MDSCLVGRENTDAREGKDAKDQWALQVVSDHVILITSHVFVRSKVLPMWWEEGDNLLIAHTQSGKKKTSSAQMAWGPWPS